MLLRLSVKVHGLWSSVTRRLRGEAGAVATEYALLLILIALAIIASATALGKALQAKYSSACTSLGSGAKC